MRSSILRRYRTLIAERLSYAYRMSSRVIPGQFCLPRRAGSSSAVYIENHRASVIALPHRSQQDLAKRSRLARVRVIFKKRKLYKLRRTNSWTQWRYSIFNLVAVYYGRKKRRNQNACYNITIIRSLGRASADATFSREH